MTFWEIVLYGFIQYNLGYFVGRWMMRREQEQS